MQQHLIFCCAFLLSLTNCVQSVTNAKIHPNCPEIPATTFEKIGLDAKAGALQFGQLVTVGEFSAKSDPAIISGISQSVRDDQITDALVCAARERGELKSEEQIAHAWKVARFYRLNPTPADAMEFHKQNPFPTAPGNSQTPATYRRLSEEQKERLISKLRGKDEGRIITVKTVDGVPPEAFRYANDFIYVFKTAGWPFDRFWGWWFLQIENVAVRAHPYDPVAVFLRSVLREEGIKVRLIETPEVKVNNIDIVIGPKE
jgi:hypothetical protein